MFGRVILDDADFHVTLGLLGGVKATLKWRNLSRSFSSEEAAYLKAALDEFQSLGGRLAPDSVGAAHIVSECAGAVIAQGDAWRRVFLRTSPRDLAENAFRSADTGCR